MTTSQLDHTFRTLPSPCVWLVRGGSSTEQTDVGTWAVYARYLQKISSIYGSIMYYFQKYHGGEGIHGSSTMIDPFYGHSHGCVNMYIPDAKVLWNMTLNRRHVVTVYGAWS
jgi:lipoprotein-anchoring transpeptidase ErfK/SrfK